MTTSWKDLNSDQCECPHQILMFGYTWGNEPGWELFTATYSLMNDGIWITTEIGLGSKRRNLRIIQNESAWVGGKILIYLLYTYIEAKKQSMSQFLKMHSCFFKCSVHFVKPSTWNNEHCDTYLTLKLVNWCRPEAFILTPAAW